MKNPETSRGLWKRWIMPVLFVGCLVTATVFMWILKEQRKDGWKVEYVWPPPGMWSKELNQWWSNNITYTKRVRQYGPVVLTKEEFTTNAFSDGMPPPWDATKTSEGELK